MYYWYIAHRGRVWKPDETCVVVCSIYGDLEKGDVVHPAGTEDFGGATIIDKMNTVVVKRAWDRGFREIYSNLPDYRIKALLEGES